MKFIDFVQYLQKLEEESSRIEMTKILAQLFQKCSAEEIKIIAYFSQGSLFAPYKNKQFNIATKGMIAILADLVKVKDIIIQNDFKSKGDLGLVIENIWHNQDVGLSLLQVYDELCNIADISGVGSTEKRSIKLQELLQKVDGLGAKFIVRMITKTLRLGFSDMTILDGLSWMLVHDKSLSKRLESAYNVCADLGLVAQTCKQGGMQAIDAINIQVGIPIRPAAAERLSSPTAIFEKLGPCVAQLKLDGFRLQVHLTKSKNGTQIHFYSRNLLDMSDMFPDLVRVVSLLQVDNLICEGEAIVFDEQTSTFLPFQQTVTRKRKHDIEQASQDFPLRLYLFDILYLNGESLLEKTHLDRRKILEILIKDINQVSLQVIEQKEINSAQDLENYFLKSIDAGLEGLVVKREDAIYQPGKRNFNWIKIKREAHATMIDTIDVVILGYYVGQGKRAKFGIGAFLVGIYNSEKDQFETVAKVGTGMSDEEWKDLKKRCDSIKVLQQPKNVVCAKELYPDVWVAPEIVCTVKSDEITWSPMHTAGKTLDTLGFALRFPRFITYRFDKSSCDATTVNELQNLYQEQKVIS